MTDRAEHSTGERSNRPLYATTAYARAFGLQVLDVEEWNTAILVRPIPGTEWEDALGCYPLAVIDPNADLQGGLNYLRTSNLVSVGLVANPLVGPSPEQLEKVFSVCRRFKTHYVIDRELGAVRHSPTHRRWMRKAARECEIELVRLRDHLADWLRLYDAIIMRHQIDDIQKFGTGYFGSLAQMPEVEALAATINGRIVAMALWIRSAEAVYYHLGASDRDGYRTQAMYGIFAAANDYFCDHRLIHLGGAAGISAERHDGLARFKAGFANRELLAYFCGACLDDQRYFALARDQPPTAFFPAYRRT